MWLKNLFCLSILFCLIIHDAKSQTSPSIQDSSLIGAWKGTSICQIKNSPCHDEIVVYHISMGAEKDDFNVLANKIVDGKEEEMGVIPFKLNRTANQLTAQLNGIWTFTIKGRNMDGILTVNGALYRIIKLTKLN